MVGLPIIHVGFAHSGTTSLQRNLFSTRADLFYCGIPYSSLGRIFGSVKQYDPEQYDPVAVARDCDTLIFNKMASGQQLVISDETLVEQPAIYYTPAMMPIRMIAERLRALFGQGIVLFTLRNQFQYVISNYQVLKTNSAKFAERHIEPFDAWFAGNQTQMNNLFLRNLDPSRAIKVYQDVFGVAAVHVLPLEFLTQRGTKAYLERLSEITGLEITSTEIEGYIARNVSPNHEITLSGEQCAFIRERSSRGNAYIEEQFGIALRDYGYPCR